MLAVPEGFDPGKKYPLVVHNMGGHAWYGGALVPGRTRLVRELYLEKGYVVVAANPRNGTTPAGNEEYGGLGDVQVVLDLLKYARRLPFVSPDEIYMGGHSRGGMTTFLALKHGAKVRAAAVVAGVTDFHRWIKYRPHLEDRVYERFFPGYSRADPENSERCVRKGRPSIGRR